MSVMQERESSEKNKSSAILHKRRIHGEAEMIDFKLNFSRRSMMSSRDRRINPETSSMKPKFDPDSTENTNTAL